MVGRNVESDLCQLWCRYLEKSVAALKSKLSKDTLIHKQDNMRAMQENMQLIRHINDLRKEIQFLKHEQMQHKGMKA